MPVAANTLATTTSRSVCRSNNDTAPGADDRARTGDLDLGKVALYQLSYVRVVHRL
jgi:hypothetical protein